MADFSPLLGVAGDWAGAHDALDAYTAKAGGPPAWPEGAQPPPPERLLCGRCGGATSLVMQLYAPLDAASVGTDVHERFLYIFACLAPGCRNEAAGWSALRAQRPAPPPPALPQPAAASAPAAPPQPADDWGVAGADDWGGGDAAAGNAASTAGEGAPALDGLAEALQAAQLQGAAADAAAAKLRAGRGDAAAAQRPARPPPSAATLPEFYVAAVAEPEADGSAAAGPRDAAAARAAQLAAEYAARRGGTSTAESAAAAGEPGGGDDGGEGESWAGEQYERASVRGVDRAYLKFQKRLRRCPDQCLRYGFGGEVLWPSARRAPPPPPCGRCGAPRRFEAQLLAPLIHFFSEAPAAKAPGLLADALADWDWTTVTLHVCARSCHTEGSGSSVEYSPEALWLDIADESQALRGLLRAAAEEEAQEP